MVESKNFYNNIVEPTNEIPFVPAVDVWHLETVPAPTAPSYLYDQQEAEPASVLPTEHHGHARESSYNIVITEEEYDDEQDPERKLALRAGVASGVVGLLLGGPFLGLLLGFGAAYATQRDDAWGDTARAMGHVAATAQEQARAINQKHHVVERSRQAAQQALQSARELDQKHDIRSKTIQALQASWEAMREFVTKHKLVERSVEGTSNAIMWVVEQMEKKIKESQHRVEQEPSPSSNPPRRS